MYWHPIDTAPRDGRTLTGYSGAVGRDPIVFAMRFDAVRGWLRRVHEWYWCPVQPQLWGIA